MKLPRSFYVREDVVAVARDLLGKRLCTCIDGRLTAGMIVETEAYSGRNDKACHANEGLRTDRTEVMYHAGGKAYVYLIYGMYHMMNVVTNVEGRADAVLIRAVEPLDGIDLITERRGVKPGRRELSAGPGRLCLALGINRDLYGADLLGDTIWIEEHAAIAGDQIIASPRVRVDYAGEDALRPWRFRIKGNRWLSPDP